MSKYLVTIEGGNCVLKGISKSPHEKFGFFATRYVQADGHAQAKHLALQVIEKEILKEIRNPKFDPPTFRIDTIKDIQDSPSMAMSGFTFFRSEAEH